MPAWEVGGDPVTIASRSPLSFESRSSQLPGMAVKPQAALLVGPSSGRNVTQSVKREMHIATQTMVSNMLVTGAQRVMYIRTTNPPAISATPATITAMPVQKSGLRRAMNDNPRMHAAARLAQPDQKNGSTRL